MSIFTELGNLIDSVGSIAESSIAITSNTVGIGAVGLEKLNEGIILAKQGLEELQILEEHQVTSPTLEEADTQEEFA